MKTNDNWLELPQWTEELPGHTTFSMKDLCEISGYTDRWIRKLMKKGFPNPCFTSGHNKKHWRLKDLREWVK